MFRRLWTLVPVITEVYPHLTRSSLERVGGRVSSAARHLASVETAWGRTPSTCPTTGRDVVRHRRDRAPSRPRATEKTSTDVPIRKTLSRPASSRLVKCATRPASHLMTMTRATSPILQKRSIPSSSFAANSVRSPRNYRTRSSPPARAHSSQPHRPVGAKSAARGGPLCGVRQPQPHRCNKAPAGGGAPLPHRLESGRDAPREPVRARALVRRVFCELCAGAERDARRETPPGAASTRATRL